MSRKNTSRRPKGRLQTMIDREVIEEATRPLVNSFAASHGDYERNLRFVRNRGATTVDRWVSAGTINDGQQAAIRSMKPWPNSIAFPRAFLATIGGCSNQFAAMTNRRDRRDRGWRTTKGRASTLRGW